MSAEIPGQDGPTYEGGGSPDPRGGGWSARPGEPSPAQAVPAADEGEGGVAEDEAVAWTPRTAGGAVWRGAVVFAVAVAVIAGGSLGGSRLVGYDARLGMVAAFPAGVVVGVLTLLWLRARDGHIAAPLLGTVLAVISGAQLWHDHRGVYADHAVHLLRSGSGLYEESLLAAGAVVALIAVPIAAVAGHRNPRAAS